MTNPQHDPKVIAFIEAQFGAPYDTLTRAQIDKGFFAYVAAERDAANKYGTSENWWRAEGKP